MGILRLYSKNSFQDKRTEILMNVGKMVNYSFYKKSLIISISRTHNDD